MKAREGFASSASGRRRGWASRSFALTGVLLATLTAAGKLAAYTYPVTYSDGQPRAAASMVEDHGGWHAGIDIPRTMGGQVIGAAVAHKLHRADPSSGAFTVTTVNNEDSAILGPWQLQVQAAGNLYMLDILSVRRVTTGKPVVNYTVQSVVESPAGRGFSSGVVNLQANMPAVDDSLVAGDSLDVDYAYYRNRLFQSVFRATNGSFYWYAHIDSVHKYVSWNTYPATNANRYYGPVSGIPAGRDTFEIAEGAGFSDIETRLNFGTEPWHLHFSETGAFTFPNTAINPFGKGRFANNDPQGIRPVVGQIAFVDTTVFTILDPKTIARQVEVFVEARDNMGSPEAAADGDANNIREAGAYNVGYWVEADGSGGASFGSMASPFMMFAGAGKDSITGADPLGRVLLPSAPFRIDVNTNYHQWVSHVQESGTRHWQTLARDTTTAADGSGGANARDNREAKFKDGKYKVKARAWDVVGPGAVVESTVVVDNFRPYVKRLVVSDASGELYRAEWSFPGDSLRLVPSDPDSAFLDNAGKKRCADGDSDVTIEILFSEQMDEASVVSIAPLGFAPNLARDPAGQDSIWKATVPKAQIETTAPKAGKQAITISGKDFSGNDLRAIANANPIAPANNMRNANQVMQGPGGNDTLHGFAICQNIAFVLDDTGSMADEIAGVKNSVVALIDANTADDDKFVNYSVITFKDGVSFLGSSKDPDVIKPIINGLSATGGGDCPEASVEALQTVPGHMPRGGLCVFATDADPSAGTAALNATIAALQAAKVQVNALVTGSCTGSKPDALLASDGGQGTPRAPSDNGDGAPGGGTFPTAAISFDVFARVANETGGLFFSITKDDFDEALEIVIEQLDAGAFLKVRQDTLASPGTIAFPVPVDTSASAVFFNLNPLSDAPGDTLDLVVKRPGGAPLDSSDADVTLIQAASVTMFRVDDPAEGTWSAEVTGEGEFSFRATAASERSLLILTGLQAVISQPNPVTAQQLGDGTFESFELLSPNGDLLEPLALFDDGAHGDGGAGDGIFGGTFTPGTGGNFRISAVGTAPPDSFFRESVQTIFVGAPDITVNQSSLSFGTIPVGSQSLRTLEIRNDGNVPLEVSDVTTNLAHFSADSTIFTVLPEFATQLPISFVPSVAGSFNDTIRILSNDPDESPFAVPISGDAVAPGAGSAEPESLTATLALGDSSSATLTIHNQGSGALAFRILGSRGDSTASAGRPPVLPAAKAGSNPGAGEATAAEHLPAATDRRDGLAPQGSGGPDAFGYRFIDSFESGGPPFLWEEISGIGTSAGITAEDGSAGPFPIGFPFPFYGTTYTEFWVTSNGYLTLGGSDPGVSSSPVCLPSSFAPPALIAPLWEDLDPRGGDILHHSDGERLIVEWRSLRSISGIDGPRTFEAILRKDGSIGFRYLEIGSPGSHTVAIQNAIRDDALVMGCFVTYAQTGMAVEISRDCPWLALDTMSGSVSPGDSAVVNVTFATRRSGVGPNETLDCALRIVTDDPANPVERVETRLNTTPGEHTISGQVTEAGSGNPVAGAVVSCSGFFGTFQDTTDAAGDYAMVGLASDDYLCTVSAVGFLAQGPDTITVPPDQVVNYALTAPNIDTEPDSFEVTLALGDTLDRTLTIRNTGNDSLAFSISETEVFASSVSRLHLARAGTDRPGPLASDRRRAGVQPQAEGGPDGFGYRWVDSNEPGGPNFNWIEIEGTGTEVVGFGDDTNLGPFPIGFSFPFYGDTFTEFRVCSNGFLSFTSAAANFNNTTLPNLSAPPNLVAPLWDDLTFSGGGSCWFDSDGERLIVEFKDVPRLAGGGPHTFQVILSKSGTITYQYLSLGPTTNGATVGIQNAGQDDGLQVAFDETYLEDGLAVRIGLGCEWLDVTPASGALAPGDSLVAQVRFTTAGLAPADTARCALEIASNDPDEPLRVVSARLAIEAGTNRIDGVVTAKGSGSPIAGAIVSCDGPFGTSVDTTDGSGAYEITSLADGEYDCTASAPGFLPSPVQQATLPPDAVVNFDLGAPQLALDPDSVSFTLGFADTGSASVTVSNPGTDTLRFTVTPLPGSASSPTEIALAPARENAIGVLPAGAGERRRGFEPRAAGGPDGFGYAWQDSDETGGPSFSWTDITGTGTEVTPIFENSNNGPFPIGFTFPFYGNGFTTFRISENGWLSFTETGTFGFHGPLPDPFGPLNLVAPFWRDLSPDASSTIHYETIGNRLIVQWTEFKMPFDTRRYTFQAILHSTGTIVFQYLRVDLPADFMTIGIQNEDGSDGLEVTNDVSLAKSEYAIRISTGCPWLAHAPGTATLAPGDSLELQLFFDTLPVGPGESAHCDLEFQSNVPGSPVTILPVWLTSDSTSNRIGGQVTEAGTGNPIAGAIVTCTGRTGSVADTTDGAGDYEVTGLPNGAYTCVATAAGFAESAPQGAVLPPDATVDFVLGSPEIEVSPESLDVVVAEGDSTSFPLVVRNTGTADLVIDAGKDPGAPPPAPGVVPAGQRGPLPWGVRPTRPPEAPQDAGGLVPWRDRLRLAPRALRPTLSDPMGDHFGPPDIVLIESDVTPTDVHFRIHFAGPWDPCSITGFLSLDLDRDAGTGAHPPGFGSGLPGQDVGSEIELDFFPLCGGMIDVWDAETFTFLGSVPAMVDSFSVTVWVPFSLMGASPVPALHYSAALGEFGGVNDWAPDSGHGVADMGEACPWLTLVPDSAVIAAGDSLVVQAWASARELPADTTVHCEIVLASNDQSDPEVRVPMWVTVSSVVAVDDPAAPTRFALYQNQPNPFRGATVIRFDLPRRERVGLRIYDVSGRIVATLRNAELAPGRHDLVWRGLDQHGRRVSSGVYFYRFETADFTSTKRMLLIR